MSENTISGFIIGLVLVGAIVTTLAVYYADTATNADTDYDETTFATYNQLSAINNTAADIKNNLANMSQGGITDYVSGLFKSGYQTLTLTWQSFDTFTMMSNDASNKVQNTIPGTTIIMAALGIIVFIVFIFLIISAAIGRRM